VTSKSSEMNVSIWGTVKDEFGKDEETWIEMPIPEQFVHKIVVDTKSKKGRRLTTDVSDLYS